MVRSDFTRNAVRAVTILTGLLILDRLPAIAAHVPILRRLDFTIWQMHNGRLNADDFHAFAAGYYEGIENTDHIAAGAENNDFQLRDDFLRYEYRPNVSHPYPAGMRITNHAGMAGPDYPEEKAAHTRRIALLGDSLAVGPFGRDYPTLLEHWLNKSGTTPDTQKFELLNFSVSGYVLPQMLFVALEKAPKYHPDVYLVQLSTQEIVGSRKHMARLIIKGADLKYDFLKDIAARSGARSTDHLATIILKLKPYFNEITSKAIERIRDHAASEGAGTIVLLIPAVNDADITATDFDQLHQAIDRVGVPVIDLRNTFRGADFHALQVVPEADIHPNARGHQMLFDDLLKSLQAQPGAWAALTGQR